MTAKAQLGLENVPAFKDGVDLRFTRLNIEPLERVTTLEAAWAMLPARGQGVVTLADKVMRFDPSTPSGLLLEADVADGAVTTVVRGDGNGWRGWRWEETEGDTHVVVERTYLSSEGAGAHGLRYAQYWEKKPRSFEGKDEVLVWSPVGDRFCGFEEVSA